MTTKTAEPLLHDEREWRGMLERRHGLSPLLVGSILEFLAKAGTCAGVPLERTCRRRYNAEGEPIGPEMRISNEAGYFLADACVLVREALDESVRNMLRDAKGRAASQD